MRRHSIPSLLIRITCDEQGATAIEYGLILALIVIGSMVALMQMAGAVIDTWNYVSNAVTSAS